MRRGEILADLTPEPPEWPEPDEYAPPPAQSGTLEVAFETTWGSNKSDNPLAEGEIDSLVLDESPVPAGEFGVFAGHSSPDESGLLPEVDSPASIVVAGVDDDGSLNGMTLVVDPELLVPGAVLVIGSGAVAGGVWSIPPGAAAPDSFTPFTEGKLELSSAATTDGAAIAGSFLGVFGFGPPPPATDDDDDGGMAPIGLGLVINELAAKGDPLDWFELHNTMPDPVALVGFEVADSLTDAGKRVAFPAGTILGPGAYMQFSLDKDGWPGFALGGDEELGIWLRDGTLVDSVDWDEGQAPEGRSYARMPDATGDFQTVDTPTPAAPNRS